MGLSDISLVFPYALVLSLLINFCTSLHPGHLPCLSFQTRLCSHALHIPTVPADTVQIPSSSFKNIPMHI